MSGHSHWASIKHKKGIADQKRGKIFSKLARMISVAAKEGGNPETNAKLRQALDEAKKFNMPKDNVERAIRKGTGEEAGEKLEEVMYEALGPGGIQIILEGITDNKNRTLLEVKQILQKHNAKLADEGSVKYQFEQKGIVLLKSTEENKEDLELKAIEAGAEDTIWQRVEDEEFLEVTTKIESLEKIKQNLEEQGIEIESSTLGWTPKTEIDVSDKDKENCEKLFEDLDNNDAIQEIYSNLRA